jgi:hypothetical protein
MLTVDSDISADAILPLAVDKLCSCDWHLPRNASYKLLYPDGQEVQNIPGTDISFTLQKYKDFLGKAFQKIVLYICEADDCVAG